LTLTGLALIIVFRKIEVETTLQFIRQSNWIWLIPALVLFNSSKFLASFRLNHLIRLMGIHLTEGQNLKLYYIGMFYNLFLPGGIGGDGYKVYRLKKAFESPLKKLIGIMLYDRINGVSGLFFWIAILGLVIIPFQPEEFEWLWILGFVLLYPAFYLFTKCIFPYTQSVFVKASSLSIGVQLLQLICSIFILKALHIDDLFAAYLLLFLISSLAAALPFTIGGVGARELVFVYGSQYFSIDQNSAVAFSLIFFLITAISSLAGTFIKIDLENAEK